MHICTSLLPARAGCEHRAVELPCSTVGGLCPAPHSELLCIRAFLFPLCALLAALTGAPCAAFSARAEAQAGCSWAVAAPVLHSPQPPCLGVWLACCQLTEALKQGTVIWALCVPSAPSSVRLPLLKGGSCTGSLISTAAGMVRFEMNRTVLIFSLFSY